MKLSQLNDLIAKAEPMTNIEVSWSPIGKGSRKVLLSRVHKALTAGGYETMADSLSDLDKPYTTTEELIHGVTGLVHLTLDIDFEVMDIPSTSIEELSPNEIVMREGRSARPGDIFLAKRWKHKKKHEVEKYRVVSNNGKAIIGDDLKIKSEYLWTFELKDLPELDFQILERSKKKIELPKASQSVAEGISLSTLIALMLGCSCLSLLGAGLIMLAINGAS